MFWVRYWAPGVGSSESFCCTRRSVEWLVYVMYLISAGTSCNVLVPYVSAVFCGCILYWSIVYLYVLLVHVRDLFMVKPVLEQEGPPYLSCRYQAPRMVGMIRISCTRNIFPIYIAGVSCGGAWFWCFARISRCVVVLSFVFSVGFESGSLWCHARCIFDLVWFRLLSSCWFCCLRLFA